MDAHFQAAVLGTGLIESITAAALAKAGVKVLHVDSNTYYGDSEASFTIDELRSWVGDVQAGKVANYCAASLSGEAIEPSRSYSLTASPSVVVSTGPFISALIGSGVSRYGGFKLLENVYVQDMGAFKKVPGSKEEIFKSKDLSLIDKRKLMRFLQFAASDFETSDELKKFPEKSFTSFLQDAFSINDQLAATLTYALAFCESEAETVQTALPRVRQYLRSAGRYGPSPFLVGQYGGLGELAQGFCRSCAVSGGTYILGRKTTSIEVVKERTEETGLYTIKLDGISELLSADVLLVPPNSLSALKFQQNEAPESVSRFQAHGIIVLDCSIISLQCELSTPHNVLDEDEISDRRPMDSGILVFPPPGTSSGTIHGPVNVLINGDSTLSCPPGRTILYLTTSLHGSGQQGIEQNPEHILRPYLDRVLQSLKGPTQSQPKVLLSAFFCRTIASLSSQTIDTLRSQHIFACTDLTTHITNTGDVATKRAEALFRQVTETLGISTPDMTFWPLAPPVDDDDE